MKFVTALTLALATVCVGSPVFADQQAEKKHRHHHRLEHYFNRVDTNQDGFISQQEQLDFSSQRFLAADENGDGMLTREEMKKMRGKHRGGMKKPPSEE